MNVKNYLLATLLGMMPAGMQAQGWPAYYDGVMLQGFYWDSFSDSCWKTLEGHAQELAPYFDLVWVPQSGNCGGGQSMGYDDLYWFENYSSSFGTEQELRSMIATFSRHGIKTIADVVINHRKTLSSWVDFPKETYKGVTHALLPSDICANDDGGATREWAAANGHELSRNNDTGEDWGGMRDLDHNSANVQRTVLAYLDFLKNDLGYAGYRYDMVKGYASRFTGLYNSTSQPEFSVGEYWDGNAGTVQGWLDGTRVDGKIQSAAFDFPFRYTVRDAVAQGDWTRLDGVSLAGNKDYCRYAVTFVENHDTELRSPGNQQDPIRRDTLAANAYMLAMPGTPCVFFKHWRDCKRDIAKMIKTRQMMGVGNQSTVLNYESTRSHHAHIVNGSQGALLCVVGSDAAAFTPGPKWKLAASGYHWAYYTDQGVEVGDIEFPEDNFEPYTITVYVNVDQVGWNNVNFWTWGGDGTHAPDNNSWPGDRAIDHVSTVVTDNAGAVHAGTFYYKEYSINTPTDCVSFVFSTGSGSPQTVDVTDITGDTYMIVMPQTTGGKHLVETITARGSSVTATRPAAKARVAYTLDGRPATRGDRGIHIVDGKKHLKAY